MRLIDADAVHAAIEKLLYPAPNRDSILYNCGVNDALNVIEDALSVTDDALSVTDDALSVTDDALSVTDDALSVIDEAKCVDAVPVVRCGDCEYSDKLTWADLAGLIH